MTLQTEAKHRGTMVSLNIGTKINNIRGFIYKFEGVTFIRGLNHANDSKNKMIYNDKIYIYINIMTRYHNVLLVLSLFKFINQGCPKC